MASTSSPELAPDPPPTPGLAPDERSPLRRKITYSLVLAFTVGTFAVWIYAFFFYDPGLMIDELADRTFPTQAEKVCVASVKQLDQLPLSNTAANAGARADTVEQANRILQDMVTRLRPLVPQGQGKITSGIDEWVSDWETFLNDRTSYVDGLRKNPDTRFEESRKANRQISLAIDSFAQVNRMDSCATPGDVG